MKILLPLIFGMLLAAACTSRSEVFTLQPGDLLFQDLDCGPYCDAIEKVTTGYRGAKFSHMGMVVKAPEAAHGLYVIEAVGRGVVLTPLDSFLHRSADEEGTSKVVVGRLQPEYSHLIEDAVKEALALQNKPYDPVYDITDDAYYCSEMIYEAFRRANQSTPFFAAAPMTFVDPDTHQTFPVWETYFADLGVPIPEGEPGINPGLISRSDQLDIVHMYGVPEGWE